MTTPRTRSSFVPMLLIGVGALVCVGLVAMYVPIMECDVCMGLVLVTNAEGWEGWPSEMHPDFEPNGTYWACDRCDEKGKITLSRRLFDRHPSVHADQASNLFLGWVKENREAAR